MPPRSIRSLSLASSQGQSNDDSESPTHTTFGRVSSVSEHYDNPNMARIEVAHRRPPQRAKSKSKKSEIVSPFHSRPTSTHLLPKSKAKHYPVGARVKMTMQPMPMVDNDGDYDGGADDVDHDND